MLIRLSSDWEWASVDVAWSYISSLSTERFWVMLSICSPSTAINSSFYWCAEASSVYCSARAAISPAEWANHSECSVSAVFYFFVISSSLTFASLNWLISEFMPSISSFTWLRSSSHWASLRSASNLAAIASVISYSRAFLSKIRPS